VDGKVSLDERLDPWGQHQNAPLGLGAVRAAFTVDREPVALPIDVVLGELGQLGDAKAGVEECPDYKLLAVILVGVE